ncbi:MAG: hypothetical protein BRC41_13970 [Cyanobacteria bacterium QH_9_48_43]|nr:MAG: hypothetical protein BRC41_13970 [Cyanobacteria bacterium QH_9_48_43]
MTPTAVNLWVQRYRTQGEAALAARQQGRPRHPSLSDEQAAETTRLMRDQAPDQLGLPYALWTREAVGELIQQQWGIQLSQTTVGRYLRAWSLSPQKPAKRAREQYPEAVRGWMEHQYPALHRRAQREGAQIHWGDEMGLRSDHQSGTCWAPKALPSGRDHRAALWLQCHLQPDQPRHPALSGIRGAFYHRGVFGLSAPLGALGATQGVSDCGPPSGASSPPSAAVGGPALGPAGVVLSTGLQSRAKPGRVLEPGHQGECHTPAATA